jgi:hypothetical protein
MNDFADREEGRMRGGMKRRAPRTLGLVLSGGGARGAFQVGVYERLLEDPRFADGPAVLSGTSAGGINAALIAAGKTPREMLRFWREIGDDPPVKASSDFFSGVLRTLTRLTAEETVRWVRSSSPLRAFLQRLGNHSLRRPADVVALWVEYLLTARFELVSRFLEGIREPFVADTKRLRERLVDVFGGERVPTNGLRPRRQHGRRAHRARRALRHGAGARGAVARLRRGRRHHRRHGARHREHSPPLPAGRDRARTSCGTAGSW